ncbi:MAG: aminotransferase class III-fold pyridoxal phosphate-dependent enzyme, partial [Solirubrobacteraceae bacterium]
AALEATDDPALLANVREQGRRLAAGLAELPHVLTVRGRGLMLACELDVSAPPLVPRGLAEQRIVLNATGPCTLRLLPPLIVTREEIDDALARIGALLGG